LQSEVFAAFLGLGSEALAAVVESLPVEFAAVVELSPESPQPTMPAAIVITTIATEIRIASAVALL
jgi:hypothetical protein